MTVKIQPLDNDGFVIEASDLKPGQHIVVSKEELTEIADTVAKAYGTRNQKSERKMVLSRLSFLEAWKKRSISNIQRTHAELKNRIDQLETVIKTTPAWLNQDEQVIYLKKEIEGLRQAVSGELDMLLTIFNHQRAQLHDLEKRIMSDGRKISLESRMTSLESAVKSSPSRLTQDAKITHLENHIEDLNQYIAGELDVITKHIAKTDVRVCEMERLDGLHQMFSKNQLERIDAVEKKTDDVNKQFQISLNMYNSIRDNQNGLAAEQDKQQAEIKDQRDDYHAHFRQLVEENKNAHAPLWKRIENVEEKQVSPKIKNEEFPPGSLAEALRNRDIKKKDNLTKRDAKGRFK
jgi:ASC-1-like (ASCH) protein